MPDQLGHDTGTAGLPYMLLAPYCRVDTLCCGVEFGKRKDVPAGVARREYVGSLAGFEVMNVLAEVKRCVRLNGILLCDDHRRHRRVGVDCVQTIGCHGKPNTVAGNRILGSDFKGPSEEAG